MFGMKRITIAQHERGLLFRNRSFEAVLEPGVRWRFDPLGRTETQVFDLAVPEFEHPRVDFLLEAGSGSIAAHVEIVQLNDREVGLVYKNGNIADEDHSQPGGRGREGGAGQSHQAPRGDGGDPVAAQHRAAHG